MRRLVICVLALQVVHILGLPSLQRLEKRAFQRGHPSFDMEPEELCKMCMEVLEEQVRGFVSFFSSLPKQPKMLTRVHEIAPPK